MPNMTVTMMHDITFTFNYLNLLTRSEAARSSSYGVGLLVVLPIHTFF